MKYILIPCLGKLDNDLTSDLTGMMARRNYPTGQWTATIYQYHTHVLEDIRVYNQQHQGENKDWGYVPLYFVAILMILNLCKATIDINKTTHLLIDVFFLPLIVNIGMVNPMFLAASGSLRRSVRWAHGAFGGARWRRGGHGNSGAFLRSTLSHPFRTMGFSWTKTIQR